MNWLFWRRRRGRATDADDELQASVPTLRGSRSSTPLRNGEIDFKPFESNDASLKIWLPERVDEALKELDDHFRCSQSEIVREMFFVHVYGIYEYEAMREQSRGFFKPYEDTGIRFSRSPNLHPDLGKNTRAFKVWMPAKLKEGLQGLADRGNMKLSQYCRELLILNLLGYRLLPNGLAALAAVPDMADDDEMEGAEE